MQSATVLGGQCRYSQLISNYNKTGFCIWLLIVSEKKWPKGQTCIEK